MWKYSAIKSINYQKKNLLCYQLKKTNVVIFVAISLNWLFTFSDLFIVVISLTEIFAPLLIGQSVSGSGTNIFKVLRVLRAFRSLRVLRTIKFLENIQVILVTCLYSFKSLGAIMMLMTLFLGKNYKILKLTSADLL